MSKSVNLLMLVLLMLSIAGYSQSVTIGKQVWSTKNLNAATFRNGEAIPEVKSAEEWSKADKTGQAAWCYYENDPANGEKYGKLYNWYAVKDPRGLCPTGWHVPSDAEWTVLTDYLGAEDAAGVKMKSTSGWDNDGSGNNSSGFAGLPGGYRGFSGSFNYVGSYGCWWSSTEFKTPLAWLRYLGRDREEVLRYGLHKDSGMSVRCLRD